MNRPARRLFRAALFLGGSALLAGCAAGPDYVRPEPPKAKRYTETALAKQTASAKVPHGQAQRFVAGKEIPLEWWSVFHSPQLNATIGRALAQSPTLAAAVSALRATQENVRAQVGAALYPQLDANLVARRQKSSGASFGGSGFVYGLYTATLQLSYDFDVAGALKRELEAADMQLVYQRFQLEAAYLSLTSNLVAAAVRDAALRAQLQATERILRTENEQLDLVRRRFQLGALTQADVLAQRTRVSQTRALLPPLQKALAQNRHLMAMLLGSTPEDASLPRFDLRRLSLPKDLPLSLPSALVRQRPDIRAAEAMLHQACAEIGVADARLYPNLNITADLGTESAKLGDFFTGGTFIWSVAAGLTQPLFHGGELRAKRRAALATYDQATAQYRDSILHAFREVADVLRAIESDADALKAQAQAAEDARASLELARRQLQAGAVSYLALLDAQRQYEQTQVALVQAEAARFADTAALFQALGGGWWNGQKHFGPGLEEEGGAEKASVSAPASKPAKKAAQEEKKK